MTKASTPEPEIEYNDPERNDEEYQIPDKERIANLEAQLQQAQGSIKSLEAFANIVVRQRNESQTEAARYLAQLTTALGGN